MANRFPTGLYTEGAVVFDSQPYVNFYTQMQLRKQAKEEALDNYFRDFGKNITPSGMRNQDIPVLTQKNAEWRDFYRQHKPAILNPRLDGGKAYSEYMSRYQDQLGTIQQSKSLADVTKQLGQLRADPKKAELLSDEALENMAFHDKAINDPEHRAFNLNALTYKPPPYDAKMRESVGKMAFANAKPSEVILGQENLPNYQIKTKYGLQYSPEDLQAAGNFAKSLAASDRSIKNYAQKELLPQVMNDPNLFNELNNVYKQAYGKNAEDAEDFYAAELIRDSNRRSIKEKIDPDTFGRQKAMEQIRTANDEKLMRLKKQIDPNDTEMNNTWIERRWDNLINEAKEGRPVPFKDPNKPVGVTMGYEINADPQLLKAFENKKREPDRIFVTDDNKIWPIYYKYEAEKDKNGNPIEGTIQVKTNAQGEPMYDTDDSKPMSLESAYFTLGYKGQTKKDLGKTMEAVTSKKKNQTYTYDGKSYTRQQLKQWYSDEEIDEAIKSGIIK